MSDRTTLWLESEDMLKGISVVSVIISFHEGVIKVLLNRYNLSKLWMLPAGFALKSEDLDNEAKRVLIYRTGIKNVFLQQFHAFGDLNRISIEENKQILSDNNIKDQNHWFLDRYIAIGYYALVNYAQVKIISSKYNDVAKWFEIDKIPQLYSDQNLIINTALTSIRKQINYIPMAASLLSEKFTLFELRSIYEAFLNRKVDSRNFQRKILGLKLIYKLDETKKVKGAKDATLYCFDKTKYEEAIKNGISFVN